MSLPSSESAVADHSGFLHAQIARLNGPLSRVTVFPTALEQRFHAWLHERAMTSLRQYLPVLVVACLLFTALSLVKIYAFAPAPFQAHDAAVFWWMVGGLGADTVLFADCVRRPEWDRWFWLYSGSC